MLIGRDPLTMGIRSICIVYCSKWETNSLPVSTHSPLTECFCCYGQLLGRNEIVSDCYGNIQKTRENSVWKCGASRGKFKYWKVGKIIANCGNIKENRGNIMEIQSWQRKCQVQESWRKHLGIGKQVLPGKQ